MQVIACLMSGQSMTFFLSDPEDELTR